MIGENVKKIRLSSGLTQRDFADRLGVSSGVITNLEYNKLSSPEKKMPLLRLISETFGVPLEWILADNPGPVPLPAQNERDKEMGKIGAAFQSEDPVVRGFFAWYGERTEQEKKEICRYVLEFAESVQQAQRGKRVLQKNTAAARSGDRMEAAELTKEEEDAVLPPPYA